MGSSIFLSHGEHKQYNGDSDVSINKFDLGKEDIERRGLEIISIPDNAEMRIRRGRFSYVSTSGNWTREAFLYIPKGIVRFVRRSCILDCANLATKANERNLEFCPTDEQLENDITNSIELPLGDVEIPSNRFRDNDLMVYIVGGGNSKKAEDYGHFLSANGVHSVFLLNPDRGYIDAQEKPFERLAWFERVDPKQILIRSCKCLHLAYRIRGFRKQTADL